MKPKSVYGELKLSEKLSNQLECFKQQFESLRENHEETSYQRDLYKKELDQLHAKYLQVIIIIIMEITNIYREDRNYKC